MGTPNQNPYGKFNPVYLKPEEFNKFIWAQGIRVRHEKGAICPHVYNKEAGHEDITCTLCDNGKILFDPKEVWVLFYQKKMDELFQVQGIWELGDVLATFPTIYPDTKEVIRVDYGDRVTLLDFTERTSDLVKKPSGDFDKLRYNAQDVQLLRTKTTIYGKDVDFQVLNGGIKWLTVTRPSTGSIYSISYMYQPVYRVVQFFHEARYYYTAVKSPERSAAYMCIQAQLRRDYILEEKKGYD